MATRKSPQELIAARNPLIRTPVTPVDIYSQAQPPVVVPEPRHERVRREDTQAEKQPRVRETRTASAVKAPKTDSETIVPYSTYLRPEKIKQIKWRALERDTKDMRIVQEAIDEYFEKHPRA